MDILKYPNKSHRKAITIPPDSAELAELMGIVFGDGGINNDWQVIISLNATKDFEYSKKVYSLLNGLFNISVTIKKRVERNVLLLICSSINLVEFLVSKGAVKGNKVRQQIDIPFWIKTNPVYKRAFVRGLMDTDGCLYIHVHSIKTKIYRNLGLCFTSLSKKLTFSVSEIFLENNIHPYVREAYTRIFLYSHKSVANYLEIFGSSNPRIFNKYVQWQTLNSGSVA